MIMRLLEIFIQFIIIALLGYSILTYWGFDTKHFLMISEGRIPKRAQIYKPTQNNSPNNKKISTNMEDLSSKTGEDQIMKTLKSSESSSSSTSTTELEP